MRSGMNCLTDSSVVAALWPGADLSPRGRGTRYLAGPSVSDPRFLLPADRRSAESVLRHFRSGGSPSARRRVALLRAALRTTGGWPAVRGVAVDGGRDGDTIEAWVASLLGPGTSMGIHLGPPRANRKPILQVLDRDGAPVAVGKVGTSPLTSRLVATEATALGALSAHPVDGVVIPRLLHHGGFHDAGAVLMSYLPLSHATGDVDQARLTAAMVSVARALGTRALPPAEAPWHADLRERASAIEPAFIRTALLRSLDRIGADREPWELGCWHGDWTAWNAAALGEEVLVWDWERFATDVPLGWDALHFALRLDIAGRAPTPDVARTLLERSPRLLAPFGVAPQTATSVAAAYLVELAVRYTADGQRTAGGRSARVEEWVLPVLDALTPGAQP